MPKYIVRTNCEYSTLVEASSGDAAINLANATDVKNWDQAWAPMEAELEDELED